jgi:D-alanyl-D-alanine carboxypeptidase (penicillin-binding protein 5/6)
LLRFDGHSYFQLRRVRLRRIFDAAAAFLLIAAFSAAPAAAMKNKDEEATLLSVNAQQVMAPEVSAEASILIEADTGAVLAEKNADRKMRIASTTKMLTALVVLEHCDTAETVAIGADFPAVEGSSMYLKPGETLTVLDLLYGLMLASGNDAAVALAKHTAGSVDAFAALMNARAAALGCSGSHFVNPHGLDAENHYATARDLALIAREAMRNETFRTIVSTKYITVAGRFLKNHNKLLWNCQGALGIKTGYTANAGRSLVSCAERDGMTLLCVTLSAPNDWQDHDALYGWGYDHYGVVRIGAGNMPAQAVPVISGLKETAAICPLETLTLVYEVSDKVGLTWEIKKFAYAPVLRGETAGQVVITKNGETIKTVPLIYIENVLLDEAIPLTTLEKIKRHLLGAEDT